MDNEPGTSSQLSDTILYTNLITANFLNSTGAYVESNVAASTPRSNRNDVQESYMLQVEDTSETYELLSFSIACVLLVICIAGIFCNTISAYVYTRPAMKAPINVLLCGLCAVDAALLVLVPLVLVLPGMNERIHADALYRLRYISELYFYPTMLMLQSCSVWLMCVITVERYIAVCHPFKALHQTTNRMKIAVSAVLLISVCYNFVRFWEYKGDSDAQYLTVPLLRASETYNTVYYSWMYILTHFIMPFSMLAILNTMVARTLYAAKKERKRLTRQEQGEHTVSMMMIVVTALFVVCNTLTPVINIIEIISPTFFKKRITLFYVLCDVSNCLIVLYCSTSWIIYYTFSRRFRILFVTTICGKHATHLLNTREADSLHPTTRKLNERAYSYPYMAAPSIQVNGKMSLPAATQHSLLTPTRSPLHIRAHGGSVDPVCQPLNDYSPMTLTPTMNGTTNGKNSLTTNSPEEQSAEMLTSL